MRDYQSVWRSKFVLSLPILICVFSLLPFFSCGTQVDYSNPFDPRAPEEIRAKGTIIGWAKKENAEDHSNIRVWVQSANHLYGVTDAQGFYYILNVPVGRYTMEAKVDDPAFRPAQGSSAVEIKQQPCPSADLLKLLPQGTSPGDCVQAGKLEVQKPPQAPKILSLSSTSFSSLQVTFPKNPPEDEVKLYRIYIAAGNDPLQPVTEGEIDAPETEGDISFEIKELKPGIT